MFFFFLSFITGICHWRTRLYCSSYDSQEDCMTTWADLETISLRDAEDMRQVCLLLKGKNMRPSFWMLLPWKKNWTVNSRETPKHLFQTEKICLCKSEVTFMSIYHKLFYDILASKRFQSHMVFWGEDKTIPVYMLWGTWWIQIRWLWAAKVSQSIWGCYLIS